MPKLRRKERPRVMFVCQYWEERMLKGVAGYAKEAGWILDVVFRHVRRADLLPADWRGHGVITNTEGNGELVEYVRRLGVPLVQSQRVPDFSDAPNVMHDERAIGAAAAEHFLSLGFENFMFVATTRPAHSERGAGFVAALGPKGKKVRMVVARDFPRVIEGLRGPVGIFAVNDDCALGVMNSLLAAGRDVPREFALLGVDDDEITCSLSAVPLSSVNLDYEGRGRACAGLLATLMRGGRSPSKRIVTPLRGVTVRESTNTRAIPHDGAATVLKFIRENYRRPVTLPDIADGSGIPLRGVQDVFKRHVGLTLAGELARLRREAALKLLKTTRLKLHAVALECGYSGAPHLSRALIRETGRTPREWRKLAGIPAGD